MTSSSTLRKDSPRTLSREDKFSLYRDGYIVVKQAVSPALVDSALKRIKAAKKGERLGLDKTMTDLVNASDVTPVLHDVMGYFDPPSICQVGVIKPSQPSDRYTNLGYIDKDVPYYGAGVHMDGNITIAAPQEVQEGEPEEIYLRHFASGPKGDLGRSPEVMGHNMVPLFEDPDMTLGLGSFTAFVFVCLNDQSEEGRGQTCLLKGAHHDMQEFFRHQYNINGHLGPEGPDWPRLNHDCPNRCGMNYLPPRIFEKFTDETSETTPDGRRWPRPTQILMEPGDACIAMYHIPHSGTRNERGTESRKNIIFRIRNKKRQPNVVVSGVTDHPDRGQMGEWLEFEEGNDAWERSKQAMCNMWDEWEGMQDMVAEMEAS
ncbi:MAG: hypothetical protein OXC80_04875 [Gammaproteobacteria bacterium]|nr:hypothetical protein [Gammaproteobacteria bacterium]